MSRLIANPTSTSCPGVAQHHADVAARASSACAIRTCARRPSSPTQAPNFCVTNFREIGQLQMDLMILALQCDLTRVASLQWSTAESTVIHEWLPLQYTGTREHHMMTHNESVDVSATAAMVDQATAMIIRADLTKIHNWYAQQFAYMLGKLKAIAGGERQDAARQHADVLDQRARRGRHAHATSTCRYVLAGSCGGQLPTGRYIDYLGDATPGYGVGQAHNKLYVTFLKLFGINENIFGLPDFVRVRCRGSSSGCGRAWPRSLGIALAAGLALAACGTTPKNPGSRARVPPAAGQTASPAADAGAQRCAVAPTPRQPVVRSAGCGKAPTRRSRRTSSTTSWSRRMPRGRWRRRRRCGRRGGARSSASTTCACRPTTIRARPYRTVYLGPGCGPPQDQVRPVKAYPMESASGDRRDPDRDGAGLLQQGRLQQGEVLDPRRRRQRTCATTASTTARRRPRPTRSSTATSIGCTSRSRATTASTTTGSSTAATPAAAGWRTSSAASSPTCCARRGASRAGCRPRSTNGTKSLRRPPDRGVPDPRLDRPVEPVLGLGRGAGTVCSSSTSADGDHGHRAERAVHDHRCHRRQHGRAACSTPAARPTTRSSSARRWVRRTTPQTGAAVPGFWQFFSQL